MASLSTHRTFKLSNHHHHHHHIRLLTVVKPQPNNRSVIGLYAVNYSKTVRCNYRQNKIYITPRPEILKEQQLINVFEKHPCDKITVIDDRGGQCDQVTGDCAHGYGECSSVLLMILEVGDCADCGKSSFVYYRITVHLHCHTTCLLYTSDAADE